MADGVIGHGSSLTDRLHHMLTLAGVEDEEIINGPSLTDAGTKKVARALDIQEIDVEAVMRSLVSQLRDHQTRFDEMAEDFAGATAEPRYTHMIDSMKNVTITDTKTGQSCFLRGSKAVAVLNRLKGGDPQAVLAMYAPLMEAKKKKSVLDESFDDEIHAIPHGAYNFPWRLGRHRGTATARFKGRGKDMEIKIISVRDEESEDLQLPQEQIDAIQQQAVAFIGEE